MAVMAGSQNLDDEISECGSVSSCSTLVFNVHNEIGETFEEDDHHGINDIVLNDTETCCSSNCLKKLSVNEVDKTKETKVFRRSESIFA